MKQGFKVLDLMLILMLTTSLVSCGGGGSGTAGGGNGNQTTQISSAKSLTAFSLAGVTGSINETNKTIVVVVSTGTDLSALAPTFSFTGLRVSVGSVAQISGNSTNDFNNPVVYTVTAENGSTTSYVVTVAGGNGNQTAQISTAKSLTAFSLAGVAGSINETNKTIVVVVPTGTYLSAFAPTFSFTGLRVSVGSVAQISGNSTNDFNNPVVSVVSG
jgi:type IV secretory pathway ATPase VirB11/archaellum biosynthesis ATPase